VAGCKWGLNPKKGPIRWEDKGGGLHIDLEHKNISKMKQKGVKGFEMGGKTQKKKGQKRGRFSYGKKIRKSKRKRAVFGEARTKED